MSKHYNWMTPEEAEKELMPGERIWVYDEVVEAGIVGLRDNGLYYQVGSEYPVSFKFPSKICRAIVPEVPSE